MGEGSDGNHINTCLGDVCHGIQIHPTGCFNNGAALDDPEAFTQILIGEIIQHDGVDAGGEHGFDLINAIHLHLDVGGVGQTGLHLGERFGDGHALGEHRHQVVILHHHRI